jgi:hypothetical protein
MEYSRQEIVVIPVKAGTSFDKILYRTYFKITISKKTLVYKTMFFGIIY